MKTHSAQWRYGTQAAVIGLMIVALGIGCSAPNVTDQTAVINVFSASPSTLRQGETAVIEVSVTNSRGEPLVGVVVNLATDPISGGSLAQQSVTTDSDGTAATIFTAQTAGTVTIQASAENAVAQYVTLDVEAAASTATITLTVNPTSLTADASSLALVSCRVLDGNGNAVPDGTEITLVAGEQFVDLDENGYFTQDTDLLVGDINGNSQWDAIGEIAATVTTTGGYATVYYTAGASATTVYIKATVTVGAVIAQSEVALSLAASTGRAVIEADHRYLRADGYSQAAITCWITDADGDPVPDGTEVILVAGEQFVDVDRNGRFNCCLDTLLTDEDDDGQWDGLGQIDSVLYTTDGAVTTSYTAGMYSGTVYVKATAAFGSALAQTDLSLFLIPDSNSVALGIDPIRLRADGVSTALITCYALNAEGAPVPDGTEIRLAAGEQFVDVDQNGYFSCCDDYLVTDYDGNGSWDAIGEIDSVVYTTDGAATAFYNAGVLAEKVYIKATLIGSEMISQDERALTLLATDSVASINLAPEWQSVQVRGTGGIEWTRVTASAFDAFGNRAPQDLPIDFLITAGPGGGENINGDPVGPVTILTDENGEATATFNSGIISGTVRIRATAGVVVSAATQVAIVSGPPAYLSVGAYDCNVPSWELVNVLNEIVAVANDQWGNEVADSTAIYFWTEQGTIEGTDETNIAFTERGVAASVWHSSKPKNDGVVWYWAETAGGEVADTSTFFESGLPGTTTIIVYPTSLLADGVDKARVVVEVYDINGVFMDTDYPIDMKTTFGSITSGGLGDGCHSSYYETELFSQTFAKDYSYSIPDDGIAGVSLLEAIAGGFYGAYDSKYVTFLSAPTYVKNCNVDVATTIPHGFTVPASVVIKDRYGNPLGGHLIALSSENGLITGSPKYTDAWGVASGFEYTTSSNYAVEVDFLVAEDQDPGYGGVSFSKKITIKDEE